MAVDAIQIVGVDCAAQPKNVGVACARGRSVEVVVAGLADPAGVVVEWVDWSSPVLIALDAPLGWPAPMAAELADHRPGELVGTAPNAFFRRTTDRVVHERIGKMPLEVGADRIARAAHGALRLLDEVRRRAGAALPVLWPGGGFRVGAGAVGGRSAGAGAAEGGASGVSPGGASGAAVRGSAPGTGEGGVIEVYPGGTLKARGLPFSGYKSADPRQVARRAELRGRLGELLRLPDDPILETNADALDAAVCVLAGLDFLHGACIDPGEHLETARKEGWIWVRDPA